MSRKIENSELQRYSIPVVIDHLASNYVMGLLSERVNNRVNRLRNQSDFIKLDDRIYYWENKLSPLNDVVPELAPLPETWQHIQNRLNIGDAVQHKKPETGGWANFSFWKLSSVFSLALCAVLSVALLQSNEPTEKMSYVAVLENTNNTPQVVATAFQSSKKLMLDILTLPSIDKQETYELWVTSKTDNQTRSLGEIPKGLTKFDRQLSDAEMRLIADSSFLIISVEEMGGSAIGEPSDMIVSKGLCIQIPNAEAQT